VVCGHRVQLRRRARQQPLQDAAAFPQWPPAQVLVLELEDVEGDQVGRVLQRQLERPPRAGGDPPLQMREAEPPPLALPHDHLAVYLGTRQP
jgi:hypothetical protein